MAFKKNIFLSLLISLVVILFVTTISYAEKFEASVTETVYGGATVKITSEQKITTLKIYKKAKNGKYILIAKNNGNGANNLTVKISRIHLSTEEKTEIIMVSYDENGNVNGTAKGEIDKLPKPAEMKPEETAKPSWSSVPIPTKPTPSIHPSEQAAPSPSGTPNPSGDPEVTEIKLNKNSVTLKIGEKDKLTYTIKPNGARPHLVWRTDANEICSIQADGTITGVSQGEATISIKADNGKMDICMVTVTNETASPSPSPSESSNPDNTNGIKLDKTSVVMKKGEQVTLKPTLTPNVQTTLTWSTSNKSVATVDANGVVTAIENGSASITVKTPDGKSATCSVTVTNEDTGYIDHLRQKLTYYGSKTDYGLLVDCDQCKLIIFKKNESGKWELQKCWNAIIGVNGPGHGGPAEMNNWAGPRSKTIKGAWRVVGKKTHGTINGKQNYITCFVPYNHESPNHHCQGIHGYEKDADSLPVNQRYLVEGCTCISLDRAIWVKENVPDNSTVIVFDKYNPMPKWDEWDMATSLTQAKSVDVPNKISLDKTSLDMKVNDTASLKMTLDPTNATIDKVTWSTSNKTVATIDENGQVKAISEGTATIKVKVLDMSASCKVTVSANN